MNTLSNNTFSPIFALDKFIFLPKIVVLVTKKK